MDNSLGRFTSGKKETSPLRRKDIHGRESARKDSKGRYSQRGQGTIDEEELYNRRREEEIKRQLQQKDAELQNLSKASDYLRSKLDQRSKQGFSDPNSSLNQRQSQPSYQGERDRSPYSLNVSRDIQPTALANAPTHLKEHINNLQSDNSGLMRRLNLVLQELDRVQREKEELLQRLEHSQKVSNDLQRMLNGDDKLDKVNRYMQDDLIYERDRNLKVRQKIKDDEMVKNDILRQLRKVENEQDQGMLDNQNMNSELQKKINQIQDLEKEHYYTQEKIRQVQNLIEQVKLEEIHTHQEKSDLQRVVESLMQERSDLLARLDNLTRRYDECVKEISHDRAEMEAHNKHHAKLITAKIIFQNLEIMQKNRVQAGFLEFKQYCIFDSKCHKKLKALSSLMERIGVYRLKNGFTQWYSNGLNPMRCKQQSENLAQKIHQDEVKGRLFHIWRKRFKERLGTYDSKTQAIQAIWDIKNRDTQIEQKRAFIIWKETLQQFKLKQARVKKLIYKLYFSKLNQAFNAWSNHSSNLDSQVRLQLLVKDFSKKQYMTLLFNNLRHQTIESKRKRDNILFHVWKAWRDYIQHRKFLMGANMAAIQFSRECSSTVLKQCVDAWKHFKEVSKLEKTHHNLQNVELAQIDQLNNDVDMIEADSKFKAKQRACESVKLMMGKALFRYFDKWREVNEDYKEKIRTTMKDKIIKSYLLLLRSAFNLWKVKRDDTITEEKQMEIQSYENEQAQLQGDIHDLKKEIKNREEFRDCSQKKNLTKCINSYEKRMKQIAVGRWRDNINETATKENGAESIIKRLRTRILRKGFDLYFAGVKYHKKRQIEEERCRLYNHKRNERLLNKVLSSWKNFKNDFQTAKRYWDRIYTRLDLSIKQRALRKWHEQAHNIAEGELQTEQNNLVNQIDELNNQIGNLHQSEIDQKSDIKGMNSKMRKQAERIIANAFARYYYIGETRGFEAWKEYVIQQKRKERLLKKIIDHQRKQQLYYVKASIKNWMMNANIQEKKDQVKKEEQKLADEQFQLEQQTRNFNELKNKLNNELEQIKKLQGSYNSKLQKSIQMIVKKVDTQDYQSKKRFLLQQWSLFVKREKNFIICIQRVISKSLWAKGLDGIKEKAKEVERARKVQTSLERFRMKFWKRTCGNAISVWRSGAYVQMNQIIEEVESQTNAALNEQNEKKAQIKEHNCERSGKLIETNRLRDFFHGWINVKNYLKLQKAKQLKLQEELKAQQMIRAVRKWSSRNKATNLARQRIQILSDKYRRMRTKTYFRAMKKVFESEKNFVLRMGNLANIHDHQALKMGLNAIFSFVKSKNYVHNKKKEVATKDISQMLNNLLMRKKLGYFNDLKYRTNNRYKQQAHKFHTIIYAMSRKLRTYIQRWKEYKDIKQLEHDVHHEGEAREEFCGERQELNNCKQFLRDEGYTDKEIQDAIKNGKQYNHHLLLKGVQRMRHCNDDLYVKPLAFDRWRKFVYFRKAFRYWMNFCNGRREFIKIDVAKAFNRWKQYESKSKQVLQKLKLEDLQKKTISNYKQLENLAEEVDDRENRIVHLNNQRDALLENYVKGQKIALFAWRNRSRLSLETGFQKWKLTCDSCKNNEMVDQLKKNIDLITAIKDRLRALEKGNEDLANENEELRQFSLDGYEIAKSVQNLSQEREKLSVDLADKAQTIRKLLDENEKLTHKLRNAQEEAQVMLKSTNSKFKPGNTGMSFASPGMRSNAF